MPVVSSRLVGACAIAWALVPRALSSQATLPDCPTALDSLDARTRMHYAGFTLEVKGDRATRFTAMRDRLRTAARDLSYEECHGVLSAYVGWFEDPHLFLFQDPTADTLGNALRRDRVERRTVDEAAIRRELSARRVDAIEGIWHDGPLRLAVVRDTAQRDGRHFVGVVLTTDTTTWPVGGVRARFTRRPDGRYDATVLTRQFGLRRSVAAVHKGMMLRLDPGMWGKTFPVRDAETGLIDTTDVHRPTVVARPRSVVISIPSHDMAFRLLLQGFVRQHGDAIRRTGLLIIDLRGNEGGSSLATSALHPWIATKTRRPTPYDSGTPVMLSSPAQVRYVRRFMGPDTSQFVRSLVTRLEANPGALVPLEEVTTPSRPDSTLDGDWRVVIMTDRGTVSASEVTVLMGLRSERTVVVGEPTAGALDYQSVSIIGLGLSDRRWALGYPVIAAHADLPRRGMRGKGIAPHVRLSWERLADPIAEVERRFGR